jgi:hypothetical protein
MTDQWFDLVFWLAYDAGVQACPYAEETAFMPLFRPGRTAVVAALIAMLATPVFAQKKDDKKDSGQPKFTDAQKQELLPVIRTIDEVMKSGTVGAFNVTVPKDAPGAQLQPTNADVQLVWRNDFLKATNQLIYVPFIVSVEAPKGTAAASTSATTATPAAGQTPAAADAPKLSSSIVAYLRVAPKGATGPAPAPAAPAAAADSKDSKDKKSDKDKKNEGPVYPFEDLYFTDLRTAQGQSPRLSRAFSVPAGSYDVYLALRERPAQGGSTKDEAPVKVYVLKQTLDVPNYWNGEFTTSSVILAEKVEPIPAPLSADAQRERPYVLGSTEIVPSTDAKFKKAQELGVIFQIYGAKVGTDKKPDVTIEYNFYTKSADGEKPFNKTPPQQMNGQTLPPNFDADAGYQLVGGQTIPLTSFPEGDYRLEIKVTDNKGTKSLTRDVLFSVTPTS